MSRRALSGVSHAARGAGASLGEWLSDASYIQRWLVLGTALGAIAGLGAVVFYSALALATHLLLGSLGGYQPPSPAGEGGIAGSAGFARPWAIPLVTTLGGLVSGSLVSLLAPEAEGHGTDAAIDAVNSNPRGIRMRTVLVKIAASAVTIGSGGSGGREGPTAQISAGFGSFLARFLDLGPEDGRIAVSVGIGSGIGAIFGAPLGGAVLAADIIYRDDFEVAALIPGLVASIVAYTTFGLFENFNPLFGYVDRSYQFSDPLRLVWYAAIGGLAGLVGLAYAKGFYGMVDLFGRIPLPKFVKPALGGLMVGLIALEVPEVLGTGYGWVQRALGAQLGSIPIWVVLLLPFLRIVATSLSIGSGGSGGIFGPGMVIGAFTGAAVWRLLHPIAPAVPHNPAPFVVAGMMACFGAIARAPLAVMIMVAEMTGSLALLAPAMIAVGIAYLIVRRNDDTIYRSQLKTKAESPASRLQFGLPLLSGIKVEEALATARVVLQESDELEEAVERLMAADVPGAPVVDRSGRFMGTVGTREALRGYEERPDSRVGRLVDATAPSVNVRTTLDRALEALTTAGGWVTVIDGKRHVKGVVATTDLVRGYHAALGANAGRLSQVSADAVAIEERVVEQSPLAGHSLRESLLPEGALVISVQRGSQMLLGVGDTCLQPGDVVTVLSRQDRAGQVRRLLSAVPGVQG